MSAASLTTPVTIADRDVPRLLDERAQRAAQLKQAQPPRHQHRDSATGQDLPPLTVAASGVADDSDMADAQRKYGDGLPRLPVPAGPQMNWLDPYVVWSLRDPRDTVFVKTTLWLFVGVLSALYLVLVRFTWWHFALHAAWVGKYATTYVLMLHCVCHRPLYKAKYHALNWIAPYALGPFYGHTWDTFYFHHIKHHHIEDNGPHDLSSTLRYQRDSAWHFFLYFMRFFLFTLIELPKYFFQKGWYATALRVVFMEAATWSLFASLAYVGRNYTSSQPELVNFAATLTLAVPVALMRFGMMSGNWAQHAFVDRSRPDCDYVQSLTCISNPYNELAFNDGYHTSHHLNPRRHWADHPGNLVACADDYAKHGTLVFTGIDFHVTWFYLMTKNYKALAQAYVHLDNDKPRPSDDAIIAMLRSRTKQMTQDEVDAYYSQTKTKLAARKTQ